MSLLLSQPSRALPAALQVSVFKRGDDLWGFTVSFLKDGVSAADVRVAFDEETTQKHDWVGRGAGLLPREPHARRGGAWGAGLLPSLDRAAMRGLPCPASHMVRAPALTLPALACPRPCPQTACP